MKNKKLISKRIMVGFIGILAITFLITTSLYIALSDKYVINQAKADLRRAGELFENAFENIYLNNQENTTGDRLRNVKMISDITLLSRFLGMQTIVVDTGDNVIFPKEGWTIERVKLLKRESKLDSTNYVVHEHFIENKKLPIKEIVFLKKYKDVTALKNEGIKTLIKSFSISLIIAILIGFSVSKRISRPIKALRINIDEYNKDNKKEINIYQSGDEIQELSESFKTLADKITRLNDRQKQFFQNSSHELKTPLMSIQGYAEAIKDGIVKGDELDSSLDIIISESQRLKKIVDDVIYLSKIDNLEDEFILKPENLKQIIEESITVVIPILQKNKIEVILNCEDTMSFNCDYEKMKRVFINLIGNGARYAKSKIIVNVIKHDNSIMVDIIDDGKGFDFMQEEKIFDRFYHGKKGGSGIGLALTKEIIEMHGGQIVAINNMNHGAIFKITFT